MAFRYFVATQPADFVIRFSDVLRMSERNSLFRTYYACSLTIRFFIWFCFGQACSCTLLRKTSKVHIDFVKYRK